MMVMVNMVFEFLCINCVMSLRFLRDLLFECLFFFLKFCLFDFI